MACSLNLLSKQEQSELTRLEGVIAHGFESFRKVGEALARIAEAKLYRASYGDFASYLRERWKLGKSRAYRLITAAEVAEGIDSTTSQNGTPSSLPGPQNVAQTQALARLDDPETRLDAWERAVEAANGKQPTAAQVEEAVDEVEAEQLEELSADVVAGLSPEKQVEVFNVEEERSRRREGRQQRQERRQDAGGRLERALELLRKVRKLVAGVGPGVDTALMMHDEYVRELDAVRAAA